MFGSSLPPVVCRMVHVLFMLFVFVCELWCPTHIVLCFVFLHLVYPMFPVSLDCFCFVFLHLVYPVLPVSLCCQFLWIVFVLFFFTLCTLCCQFLWIVFVLFFFTLCNLCFQFLWIFQFWLPLRYSLLFT